MKNYMNPVYIMPAVILGVALLYFLITQSTRLGWRRTRQWL